MATGNKAVAAKFGNSPKAQTQGKGSVPAVGKLPGGNPKILNKK